MKRALSIIIMVAAICAATPSSARAGDVRMVLWYPGEAGSTEEAQPVIDAFFGYLSEAVPPEQVKGRYFNTVKGGLDYIARQKPKVGIVSYAAWEQNRSKLGGAKVLLATLPLPGGTETETYAMATRKKGDAAATKIYSSEPLSEQFVKQQLFPNLPAGATLEQTDRIFMKLKAIAAGEDKAMAILTPIEASTLEKLKSDWAKELKISERSRPVPTARVVVFDDGWKESAKFSEAMLSAGKDPKAADILEELRLVGFSKPN